ncbi:MAG: PAS domain-containing protein [Candidatus Levybacteria bacterium]|nr:PAS domain-containing protein [Candidatus Levybacteria bacterium]
MIAISLFFSFIIALVFLSASIVVLLSHMYFNQTVPSFIANDPGLIVLHFASLVTIIPLAYVLSHQYHLKDAILSMLHLAIKTDEAIFDNIRELIIITDTDYTILSVNDAVEKTLQQPRLQIIKKPLFESIFLKDSAGNLVTKEKIESISLGEDTQNELFTLMRTPISENRFTLQIQPIKDLHGKINRISFIFSPINDTSATATTTLVTIQKAQVKYEALLEDIKNKISKKSSEDLTVEIVSLEKIEKDIAAFQQLQDSNFRLSLGKIDLAQLSKEVTFLEKDFATLLGVSLNFKIQNFGENDIRPLTVENFHGSIENFTGPFFKARCDMRLLSVLTKKLIDLMLYIASSQQSPVVSVSIEPKNKKVLTIKVVGTCPLLQKHEFSKLYEPYYGDLATKMNLQQGSGLDGILIKMISEKINAPISIAYNSKLSQLSFNLEIVR